MKQITQLKRFVHYYKPYKKTLFADLFCTLVYALSGLAFPILVRTLLNIFASGDIVLSPILMIAGIMLGMKVVEMACNYFMVTVGHIMGAKLEADLRFELYSKLLIMPASYYDNNKVGDLMSRVNNDLFEITEFSHHAPEELFIAIIKITGIFIYLSTINIYLTLIVFAVLPFLIVFAVIFNKRLSKNFKETRKKVGEINIQLEDSLSGISVVRSFNNERLEQEKFSAENAKFVGVKRKAYKNMGIFHSGILFSSGILYTLTVIAGSLFIYRGLIDSIDLVTYILYISTLLTTIETILNYTESFQRGMSGFSRFVEIIDHPVEIVDSLKPTQDINFYSDIVFENVTFSYEAEGKRVLENIDLTIPRGKKIALVGPSGAGKTTIANLIPRFYDTVSGSIKIGGVDIREIPLEKLRGNIGVVQQNVYLFNGTVKENIRYGKWNADDKEIEEAAKLAGAHEFIMGLSAGYDTDCGEKGVKLSGGQKQRISIARLFLKDPPILILDEATSALDNESEKIVQNSLDKLAEGRTTVTIAHRLTTIKNADTIIVVTEQGIAEQGSHAELIERNGIYSTLYQMYETV